MGNYKAVLQTQHDELNKRYRAINKEEPYLNKDNKIMKAIIQMHEARQESTTDEFTLLQYRSEVYTLICDVIGKFTHCYIPDERLVEWLETTPVKKENLNFLYEKINSQPNTKPFNFKCLSYGIHTQEKGFSLNYFNSVDAEETTNHYVMSLFTGDRNFTVVLDTLDFDYIQGLDKNDPCLRAFNMGFNFLMYIEAFPDCVVDGVPNSVKKQSNARVIKTSGKIIDKDERFVTPHLRSGHFRHLDNDYYKNKKGQVIFIPATMVKGKAKTVINKTC